MKLSHFFLDEVKVRGQNAKKKKKQFNTITGIVDTSLITSTVITGGVSTTPFASGVGLPVGIALGVTSIVLPMEYPSHEKFLKPSL